VSLSGIDSVNCPMNLRLKVWDKIAGDWKLEHLDKITTEIALDELDERIDLILQGKQVGRTIVDLTK